MSEESNVIPGKFGQAPRLSSALEKLPEAREEIKSAIQAICKESFRTEDELKSELKTAINDARETMDSDSELTIESSGMQFNKDKFNQVKFPVLAGLLSGMGDKLTGVIHNIISLNLAAELALNEWLQSIDPKVRVSFSKDLAETRKYWTTAIIRFRISK